MWIDGHPYLLLYLVGCVLSFILILLRGIVAGLVSWVTRQNIVNKNLRKMAPPQTLAGQASSVLTALVLGVALSWLNVLAVLLWEIPFGLLGILRAIFSSTPPEAINLLQFPLKNNPYMSREAVWAYTQALQSKLGQTQLSESALISSLDELRSYYRTFDRMKALEELRALNVVSPDVVSTALDRLSKPEEEEEEIAL